MFSLKLLGGAALERAGVPVTGRAVHRRRLALLAVLGAARGRMVGRERLVGYLWAEHAPDAARHLLSESLYILRKALGEDAFVAAGDELALNGDVVASDLARFEEALEREDREAAVAAYGGAFLDGFYVADAPEFERWAEGERERLARAYARALEQLAETRMAEGDPVGAADWWKRLARHDPYSSRLALRVMQALDAAGERAAALRHASVHAALLRDELGTEPDAEVADFARRLRESPPPPAPPSTHRFAPAPAAPAPNSTEAAAGGSAVAPGPGAPPAAPASPDPASAGRPRDRRIPRIAFAGVVAALAILLTLFLQKPSPAGVDSSTFIVLPFDQRGAGGAETLTPDQAEILLHSALSRWTDVRLVDPQRARDLLARRGPPETLDDALRIAREAGAGRLLWGAITPLGDSVVVSAALYDVAKPGDARPTTMRLGRDLSGVSARIGDLAAALLGRAEPGGAPEGAAGTTSLAAWQAYQRGRLAMSRWDLGKAREELESAVEIDAGYAAAHFWLAQAMAWGGGKPSEYGVPAGRALVDPVQLGARERALASALVALSENRFPEACRAYEQMVARDSADFAAWYGMGECHRLDDLVLPDPSSPSGWRFRSSFHRAVEAYSRALRTVPSSHRAFRGAGFARLDSLLQTTDRQLRVGTAYAPDTAYLAAYPALDADTLAFVPWPIADVAAVKKETLPTTRHAALRRNGRVLRGVLIEWARAFPQSADAHDALARGLEAIGEVRAVPQGQPSAFSEMARARALATDPEQRLRLSIGQVRLHLRVGEFERARALADSLLDEAREPGPADAAQLAPLAVLTGRADRARELLRASAPQQSFSTPDGRTIATPVALVEALADPLVFGGLGLGRETEAGEARVERLIATWIQSDTREAARTALLTHVRRLSFADGAARARRSPLAQPDFVVEAQQLLARGDAAGARKRLHDLNEARGTRRPGDVSPDFVFPEAELHLALGDTARALEELDRTLVALQAMPMTVLSRVEETAGLLRAMRLRADVAAARGDRRTERQWREALETLWSGGDARVRALLRR